MENYKTKDSEYWFNRHKEAKTKRQRWLDHWQYVGKYVHTRKQNFTQYQDQGTFLHEDLFDSTAPKANRKMAAALIGLMWRSGGKSIRIEPVEGLQESFDIKEYYEWLTKKVHNELDDPRAGFLLALEEYMTDQGCFGTSGIGCFTGDEAALRFNAWGVDEISIEEGRNGFVRTIFREFELTVSRIVDTYGLENVSENVKEYYNNNKHGDLIKVLHVIAPERDQSKEKQYMSLHFELDNHKLLKKSGFFEMPVAVSRFFKKRNEIYGRSPAMEALPDILEINATKEARISAIEKSLDPPLGVYDDSVLGNEEIDTSAGGLNVFATSGRIANQAPIFPLFTVETIREADKSIEELRQSIDEHFNIDRLLDFNNKTQMTLGEAHMRAGIRNEALGSLIARQQNELFTPTIERSVSVLFRNGHLGVVRGSEEEDIVKARGEEPRYIPEAVAKLILGGKDFYKIVYMTPAARMLETSESQGVIRTWEFMGIVAQMKPDILDIVDADKSLKIVARSEGAPDSIFLSEEIVEQIRAQRQQQEQDMIQRQQMAEDMQIAETAGKAEKVSKEAAAEEPTAILGA